MSNMWIQPIDDEKSSSNLQLNKIGDDFDYLPSNEQSSFRRTNSLTLSQKNFCQDRIRSQLNSRGSPNGMNPDAMPKIKHVTIEEQKRVFDIVNKLMLPYVNAFLKPPHTHSSQDHTIFLFIDLLNTLLNACPHLPSQSTLDEPSSTEIPNAEEYASLGQAKSLIPTFRSFFAALPSAYRLIGYALVSHKIACTTNSTRMSEQVSYDRLASTFHVLISLSKQPYTVTKFEKLLLSKLDMGLYSTAAISNFPSNLKEKRNILELLCDVVSDICSEHLERIDVYCDVQTPQSSESIVYLAVSALNGVYDYVSSCVQIALKNRSSTKSNPKESESLHNQKLALKAEYPAPGLFGDLVSLLCLRLMKKSPDPSSTPQSAPQALYDNAATLCLHQLTSIASLFGGESCRSVTHPAHLTRLDDCLRINAAHYDCPASKLPPSPHRRGHPPSTASANISTHDRRQMRMLLRVVRRVMDSDAQCCGSALRLHFGHNMASLNELIRKSKDRCDLVTNRLSSELLTRVV